MQLSAYFCLTCLYDFMYIIDLCFLLPIFAAKRGWGFFIINQKSVIIITSLSPSLHSSS